MKNLETYESFNDNDNFKNWFGDSKVVDKKGQPLVVYHGSPDLSGIKYSGIFMTPFQRYKGTVANDEGVFFFSSDYSCAISYSDPKRAFDYQGCIEGVISVYLKIENPYIYDNNNQTWNKTRKVVDNVKRYGKYDGIIIKNTRDNYNNTKSTKPTTVYVVFQPNQIKSVDSDNDKYNIHSHSIYENVQKISRYKYIRKYNTNHKAVYKAVEKYLDTKFIKHDDVEARSTSSVYMNFEIGKIDYKIRFSNHSTALDSFDLQYKEKEDIFDISIYNDNEYYIEVNSVGLKTKDIINIIELSQKYLKINIYNDISNLKMYDIYNYKTDVFKLLGYHDDDYSLLRKMFYVNLELYKDFDIKYISFYKSLIKKKENKIKEKDFNVTINDVTTYVDSGRINVIFGDSYNGKIFKKKRKKIKDSIIYYGDFRKYMKDIITKSEFIDYIKSKIKDNTMNESYMNLSTTLNPKQILDYINYLHEFGYDGREYEDYEWINKFDEYRLESVRLVNLKISAMHPPIVKEYSLMKSEIPPIVVDSESMFILDGNHRAKASEIRGDEYIKAYVGYHN